MTRSPRFILLAGCLLAFGAAFANTGVFLRAGTSVSHLTGDISRLSMDLVGTSPALRSDLAKVAGAAGSFCLGAVLAGLLIHHPTLDPARPYGRTVTGIGALFLLSWRLMGAHPVWAISLAALGCGLQNSLATHYRGVILRTTHLTGLMTDLGNTLGMRLRGLAVPGWKVVVPGMLIGAFFAGGLSAAWLAPHRGVDPLLMAGIGYLLAGMIWSLVKHRFLSRPSPDPGTDSSGV